MAEVNVYPLLIDWARLMRELRAAHFTPYKVALTLGVDHQTAYKWEQGSEPSHSYGAALLVLHRNVCGLTSSLQLHNDSKPRG